jgi:hypothetical protein
MRTWVCLFFLAAVLGGVASAGDDETERRLKELEDRNREILERLKQSEGKNAKLEEEVGRMRARESELLAAEIEKYLQATHGTKGAEPAGLKTKKGAFCTLYGFLRLDVYSNSARFDNAIIPFRVIAEDNTAASRNDDQFALDVRLTRIGFDFAFGKVVDADATGKIEIDFANFPSGTSESRPTPRIRLAYIMLETTKWWLRLGQDWDVASPLFPSANAETLMWNNGNPGDRRPQIEWLWKAGSGVTVNAAIGMQGAVNNQDLDSGAPPFSSTERDGFDAGWPQFEIRGAWTSTGERKIVVGIWGYVAANETDTAFGGSRHFTSAMAGADFTVPVGQKLVVRGEVWWAQAGGDIRANAGQTIHTTTGDEIAGWGGWIELKYQHSEKWGFYAGTTLDDPDDGDVPASGIERAFTAYLGVVRAWTKTLRTGLDATFWETHYGNATLGNAVRFDIYVVLDF